MTGDLAVKTPSGPHTAVSCYCARAWRPPRSADRPPAPPAPPARGNTVYDRRPPAPSRGLPTGRLHPPPRRGLPGRTGGGHSPTGAVREVCRPPAPSLSVAEVCRPSACPARLGPPATAVANVPKKKPGRLRPHARGLPTAGRLRKPGDDRRPTACARAWRPPRSADRPHVPRSAGPYRPGGAARLGSPRSATAAAAWGGRFFRPPRADRRHTLNHAAGPP